MGTFATKQNHSDTHIFTRTGSKKTELKTATTLLSHWLLLILLCGHGVQCRIKCPGGLPSVPVALLVSLKGSKLRENVLRRSANFTVKKLNKEEALPGYTVAYSIHEMGYNPGSAMDQMDQARDHGDIAYVGPPCEYTCNLAGKLAKEWEKAMVTYGCLSTILSSRKSYTTMARTVVTYLELGRFIAATLSHFEMHTVRLIVQRSPALVWKELAAEVYRNYKPVSKHDIKMVNVSDTHDMSTQLDVYMGKACAIVLCMSPREAVQFLHQAMALGLYGQDKAFITVNLAHDYHFKQLHPHLIGLLDVSMEINRSFPLSKFFKEVNPCEKESDLNVTDDGYLLQNLRTICARSENYTEKTLNGVCGSNPCRRLKVPIVVEAEFRALCDQVVNQTKGPTLPPDITCIFDKYRPYESLLDGALMADAIGLLVKGLRSTLNSSNTCPQGNIDTGSRFINLFNTTDVINDIIKTRAFQGVTGLIHLMEDGSRYANVVLHNLQPSGFKLVARTNYRGMYLEEIYMELMSSLLWPGGGTVELSCGHLKTNNKKLKYLWYGLTASAVVTIFTLVAVRALIKRRKGGKKETSRWVISYNKLYSAPLFAGKVGALMGRQSKNQSHQKTRGWNLQFVDNDAASDLESQISQESLHNVAGHIFAKVAVLDGTVVAVKPLNKSTLEMSRALINEANQIRRLKHTNVNHLVGACLEPGNVCLVWGYCNKGSLRDVLDNTNIKLDWMFKLSFVTDIARGMNYLHGSPVGVHGRLKSTNVLVDNNWGCKITDMAMPHFTQGQLEDDKPARLYFHNLLWTAPELLRTTSGVSGGTKKGDVYSFGIIIHEIYYRGQPFGLREGENAARMIHRVVAGGSPPYRPNIMEEEDTGEEYLGAKEGLQDLMVMCWDEYPPLRLSFSTLSHNLKKIQEDFGRAANLVDQMLVMVRKYTDNLEQLVADRTRQLVEEKKNTEELLRKMLPQSVAKELKMGRPIIPESYASATLFFSDIMGFSDIALHSTPIEVVNLLNDLYICFDNVIDLYDVYKVETIADNYVVSSGLPVRNEGRHAAEIATLALHLLTNVLTFTIRHMPDKQLLLRIGIHTGSVVAGVVGRKMPRYCLFGDTVNYTSRMQSNGKPLHIHVSPECKMCLEKIGGFHLAERGYVTMKGKGSILTYFLVGKDDFQCQVPNLRPIAQEMLGIHIAGRDGFESFHPSIPASPGSASLPVDFAMPVISVQRSLSNISTRAINFLGKLNS